MDAARHVPDHQPGAVLSDLDRLVRALFDFHSRLLLPGHAGADCDAGRHVSFPRAGQRAAMGHHAIRLLHQPCAGAGDLAHSR
ncbi:hypothetical protein D3C87_1928170 [compost metagenome]